MEYLDKPPVKMIALIVKCVIISLLICLALVFSLVATSDAAHYLEVVENPLVLEVPITYVDVDYDTENGDDYNAMMVYTYNGVKYEAKYKTFSIEKQAQELVGQKVTIYVDPQDPGCQVHEIKSGAGMWLLFGSLFVMAAVFCLRIRHRAPYVAVCGWRREAVKKDILYRCRHCYGAGVLAAVLFFYTVAARYPGVLLDISFGDLVAMVAAAFAVKDVWQNLSMIRKVRADAFTLRRDTFVSKEVIPDSDGPDTYRVVYKNESTVWSKKVSKKIFDRMSEGTVVDSAYVEGYSAPVLNHISRGETF